MNYPHRILVVDDHIGILLLLQQRLTEAGYLVDTATSGEEGIKKVIASRPSLVLLDIKMPGRDGLTTMSEMLKVAPDLPVVMMSAYTEMDTVFRARREGLIRHYLEKPFDLNHVLDLVRKLLPP